MRGRRGLVAATVASAVVSVLIAWSLAGDGGGDHPHRPLAGTVPVAPPGAGQAAGAGRTRPAPTAPPAAQQPPRAAPAHAIPRGPLGARILRRTQMRTRPSGRVVTTIGTTTGYGSERVLAVVARRGRWLGVLSDHMPNSRAAWIPVDSAELLHEPYRLDVDLSARRITVRRDGRVVRRIRVAIGAPATSTPIGRFAVTDTLRISKRHPEYGCCAVAITGRQPNVPQGWTVSDRLAIHGTPDEAAIGSAVSNGCLHAREADMRWLLRKITLGAPVRIRA
jgi:lipoprotein-anchoring transpeptidase ErfK/SrfK